MTILNFTRLVLLTLWLGAAAFFGVVVAPTAFTVLRSFAVPNASEIAGTIVTRALSVVSISGLFIALFLLVTAFARRNAPGRVGFLVELVCLVTIVLATGIGHWVIAARMLALRAAMALPIDQIPVDDPRRIAFNSLHGYSVNVFGVAMIAALLAVVLIARSLSGRFQG
jgi:uncharacterized membrane protein YhdT